MTKFDLVVYCYDALQRDPIPFRTSKNGDVGHDLHIQIKKRDMSFIEKFVASLLRIDNPFFIIWPFQIRTLRSGIYLSMHNGVWCEIRARSSAAKKKLSIIAGIIDSGYHGELYTVIRNLALTPRLVFNDERYSQVIFHTAVRPKFERLSAEQFSQRHNDSDRGSDGFGSTGL